MPVYWNDSEHFKVEITTKNAFAHSYLTKHPDSEKKVQVLLSELMIELRRLDSFIDEHRENIRG